MFKICLGAALSFALVAAGVSGGPPIHHSATETTLPRSDAPPLLPATAGVTPPAPESAPPVSATAGSGAPITTPTTTTTLRDDGRSITDLDGDAEVMSSIGCNDVDQTSLSSNTCMAYFSQTGLAQSFITEATSICGARIDLEPGTGGADVTIALWDGLPTEGGVSLGSGTAIGVPDGGAAVVSFGASIPVTPFDQYFLLFGAANGNPCIAGSTSNPYPGGHVYANGYGAFPEFDYVFETYGSPHQPCMPIDQMSLDENTCMAFLSQTDLAQSFRTEASMLCGARVKMRAGSGTGSITIALWDGLPNDGGTSLASGTDPSVPDGGWAVVDFGGTVPVEAGRQYYLVFTGNEGNPCIAGDTDDPYPGGHVYANSGFGLFPDFDYTFEVWGTRAAACGPIDQSALDTNTCMAYFSQGDLAQSFTTTATSLCGVRVDLRPGTGGADVTVALFDALPIDGGVVLASGTDFDVPDGGRAIVDFGSVAVTPGRQYFLLFGAANGDPCIAGNVDNPYHGGHVYANSGYSPYPDFDYAFETYGPQVSPCGSPDQTQLSINTCMATFAQADLAQSFTTDVSSLCGASIELSETWGEGGTVTIQLWDGLPNAGGIMLAEGTDEEVPDGGTALVSFGAGVPVTPGAEYFLVFSATGNACIAGDTNDPYPGGHVYANTGFGSFPSFDYAFRTYGEGGPACGAPDLTQLDENTCMAFFSQTDLAQSFTANTSALCGARVDLREGTGGGANITIGLWDALPDEGGTLLASGTDFGVADGGAAIVDFGATIPVTPGVRYYLVFTATNGNPCIAGDTGDPLPGGHVHANGGYLEFPRFDYSFETYGVDLGCAADCDGSGDGVVDVDDLLDVFANWGNAGPCDVDGSGVIDVNDLLAIFAAWGPCP